MPIHLTTPGAPAARPVSTGRGLRLRLPDETPDATSAAAPVEASDTSDGPFNPLTAILTGGALIGGAALAHNPSLIGKGAQMLLDLRQQLMLSGLAAPKAAISNIGGAAINSIERGSMAPLREMFSMDTVRDLVNEIKTGAQGHVQAIGTPSGKAAIGPSRLLGAIDNASQHAMMRAGMTTEEAEKMAFQTPLGKSIGPGIGDALDSPAARYLLPFRRTPFNQFVQGFHTMKPDNLRTMTQRGLMGGVGVAGAIHGAETADEKFPTSIGLGAAAANKYALPYILAAIMGRQLAGGRDPEGLAGEALPVSEYGLASGLTQPTKSFTDPAGLRALKRLLGDQ